MFNVETKKIRKLLRLMDYCLYWQVYIAFNEWLAHETCFFAHHRKTRRHETWY